MNLYALVHNSQGAAIALGIFTALWGLQQFGSCLIGVLLGRYDRPTQDLCPYHAGAGMMCVTMLLFCTARMNTLHFIDFGNIMSGALFMAGIITASLTVALGVWAKGKSHPNPAIPLAGHPALSTVFRMMFIIVLAFILLGLVRSGLYG